MSSENIFPINPELQGKVTVTCTVKILIIIITCAFNRIIIFYKEGGGRLLEAMVFED